MLIDFCVVNSSEQRTRCFTHCSKNSKTCWTKILWLVSVIHFGTGRHRQETHNRRFNSLRTSGGAELMDKRLLLPGFVVLMHFRLDSHSTSTSVQERSRRTKVKVPKSRMNEWEEQKQAKLITSTLTLCVAVDNDHDHALQASLRNYSRIRYKSH